MVETFLIHFQILILISDLLSHSDHQIARCSAIVEVVAHHIVHTAKLALLTHVEMAHQHQLNIVLAHHVHESILLVLRQIGSRRGSVIVRRAEQPIVADDNTVAVISSV